MSASGLYSQGMFWKKRQPNDEWVIAQLRDVACEKVNNCLKYRPYAIANPTQENRWFANDLLVDATRSTHMLNHNEMVKFKPKGRIPLPIIGPIHSLDRLMFSASLARSSASSSGGVPATKPARC